MTAALKEAQKMQQLTREQRWKRDGERWRYIYLLERELAKGRFRPLAIRILLAICIMQAAIIVAFLAGWLNAGHAPSPL